jgi:predicted nucleotide-binding protein (sugar kinase/HSP70/actin superfamily)
LVLTYPYLGNLTITVKALLDDLKVDYVLPTPNTAYALELGTRMVPEGACLPLKICVGTLVQACQHGADTIAMVSGLGPCRFGYYCQMQKEILGEAGYETDSIHLVPIRKGVGSVFHELNKLVGNCSKSDFVRSAFRAGRIAYQVDRLEQLYFNLQPREVRKGESDACYKAFQRKALDIKGTKAMWEFVEQTRGELSQIRTREDVRPLRIGIVGEYYDVVDPFSSSNLQEKLGRMGVEVTKNLSISEFIGILPRQLLRVGNQPSFTDAARPYLKRAIGGHAQETLGYTALMARDGFDGVIQLYPLGCMPEIVANCIMPTLSLREDIPVLSLILDEMTAEAGMMTRVEAFLDLLASRRERPQLRPRLGGTHRGDDR